MEAVIHRVILINRVVNGIGKKEVILMDVSKALMVSELKKRKDKYGCYYSHCWTKTGRTRLEDAPEANVFCMYNRVCLSGRKAKAEEQLVLPL